MHRVISTELCIGVLIGSLAFAAEEQIVQDLSGNGSRTTRPFTVKDGWELRWTATNELSLFLLDAQGQPLEALGYSIGDAGGTTHHGKGGTYLLQRTLDYHSGATAIKFLLFDQVFSFV